MPLVESGTMRIMSTSDEAPEDIQANLEALDARVAAREAPASEGEAAPVQTDEARVPESTPAAAESEGDGLEDDPVLERDANGQFTHKAKRGTVAQLKQRMAQRTWELEEARREMARVHEERTRLVAELEAARRGGAPAAAPAATPAAVGPEASGPDGKPRVDAYETYEGYVEALAEWTAEQKLSQREAVVRERERQSTWNQRVEAARAKLTDYDAVMHNAADVPVSGVMREAILSSDRGPEVLHYLATHPDQCRQLAEDSWQTPLDAAPLMRRLLDGMMPAAVAPGPTPTAVRKAVPAPIKPVGAGPVVTESSPDDLPFGRAYVERMNTLEAKRRGR